MSRSMMEKGMVEKEGREQVGGRDRFKYVLIQGWLASHGSIPPPFACEENDFS